MDTKPDIIEQACTSMANRLGYLRKYLLLLQLTTPLLAIAAAFYCVSGSLHPFFSGVIFALVIVVDSIIYRLANQTHNGAEIGSTLSRYSTAGTIFLAIGISAYQLSGLRIYLFAVVFSAFLWGYLTLLIARYITEQPTETVHRIASGGLKPGESAWVFRLDRLLLTIYALSHSWLLPAAVLIWLTIEMPGVLFLAGLVVLTLNVVFILRLLGQQETEDARAAARSGTTFLFYMFGVSVLLVLVARLPFRDVLEAVRVIGPEILWLLLVPAAWIIPYAMTLQVLLDYRVSFQDALYTQISGDAFNSITPLLGMGGEPYKAKHLSNFVSLEDASRAIVQSRLIHALSGVLFAAIVILVTLAVVDLSHIPGFTVSLAAVAFLMVSISGLLLWITMSRVPTRVTGWILSRFRLIDEFRHDRLPWKTLCLTVLYKIVGRIGKFLELYVIFRVLDIIPAFADMVLVEAMIMASISIFFFVPQGLGVNEAGIVTAFTIAGYAAATGVVFGLIRRARMVVYALFGLLVYLFGKTTRFGKSRYRTGTNQTVD